MNDEPSLESLRQMTGAPDIDEPLVSETAFDTVDKPSERPAWKMPLPKLLVVGAALVPVFGAAGYFLVSGQQTQQAEAEPPESQANAVPEEGGASSDLEEAQAEIARLKSDMALDDQAYVAAQTSENAPKPPTTTPEVSPPTTRATPVSSTPAPQIRAQPTPSVSYRPAPRPVRTAPVRPAASAPVTASAPRFSSPNPTEQWQRLARLGSYGTVEPAETETASKADVIEASLPVARFSPHSTPSPLPSSPEIPEALEIEPELDIEASEAVVLASTETPSASPEILEADEDRILQETSQPSSLIAGTRSSGQLTTPVILSDAEQSNRYVVELDEPLVDNQGRAAIPAGSDLTVQVDTVGEDRLVQLSATAATWEESGYQQEIILPAQVIQIRGEDGNPLLAQGYGDVSGEIAAMDATEFALGAVRGAAEIYTRPNTRVQTNDGSTVITQENPGPNLLAGALEGGTNQLLDTLSERNQRAREALAQRPQVLYLEENTPVQVFVNSSMQLPL